MKAWFLQKKESEQKIIVISAALVLLLLLYSFIYLPMARENTSLQSRIVAYQGDIESMQEMAQQIKALGGGATSKKKVSTLSNTRIMTLIEQSAKQQRLKITQIKPLSKKRLLIVLDDALFNATLRWLDGMSKKYNVKIEKFVAQTNKDLTHLQITLSY